MRCARREKKRWKRSGYRLIADVAVTNADRSYEAAGVSGTVPQGFDRVRIYRFVGR